MPTYHSVTQQIVKLLESRDYWFETFEHEAVRTSEEAAKVRTGYSLEQGAKAIIIRVKRSKKDKEFVMVVLPGHQRFDGKKIKNLLGAKDIRFATTEEVGELTDGIEPGGVPPFGNLFDMKVIVDPSLMKLEKIVFNAGDRRFSVAMKAEDYKEMVSPEVVDIMTS